MKIKIDTNIVDYSTWLSGTTGSVGDFTQIAQGGGIVNQRNLYTDPFGNSAVLWNSTGGTTSSSIGGFDAGAYTADTTKLYRLSCWIKRTSATIDSGTTLAFGDSNVNYINRTTGASGGTYLFGYNSGTTTLNIWKLYIVYLMPYGSSTGTTNTDYVSRIYTTGSTTPVSSGTTEYAFKDSTSNISLYVGAPYLDTAAYILAYPRIDIVNGTEPSISTLVNGEGPWRTVITGSTKINLDTNKLDYSTWVSGTTGTTGYWTSFASTSTVNERVMGTDPFGSNRVMWYTHNDGTTGGTSGGFTVGTAAAISCDPTQTYRYSVWVKRTSVGTAGNIYFGPNVYSGATAKEIYSILTGVHSTAYYFTYIAFSSLATYIPVNEWRLLVGYIWPYGTPTGTTYKADSGIWKPDGTYISGPRGGYSDLAFYTNDINRMGWRLYAPESGSSGITYNHIYPRIDLVDGKEPSITTLLAGEGPWRSVSALKIKIHDYNLFNYDLTTFTNIGGDYVTTTGPYNYSYSVKRGIALSGSTDAGFYNNSTTAKTMDPTKDYRYSVWMMVTGGTLSAGVVEVRPRTYVSAGASYSLTPSTDVTNSGSTSADFSAITISGATISTLMPNNEWRLFTFTYRNYLYSGNTDSATTGVYKPDGTNLGISTGKGDLKMHSGTTLGGIVVYQLRIAIGDLVTYSAYPRLDLIDGTEPSITTLLTSDGPWRKIT